MGRVVDRGALLAAALIWMLPDLGMGKDKANRSNRGRPASAARSSADDPHVGSTVHMTAGHGMAFPLPRHPYLILRQTSDGAILPTVGQPYAYGWFGVAPRRHTITHQGYYGSHWLWPGSIPP